MYRVVADIGVARRVVLSVVYDHDGQHVHTAKTIKYSMNWLVENDVHEAELFFNGEGWLCKFDPNLHPPDDPAAR